MTNSPIKRFYNSGKEIIILGTAHVSKQSAEDARILIETEKPDTVCLELCSGRLDAMKDPEKWKNTDIFSVIKNGKSMLLLSQLILSAYQKRIAQKLGIEPGAEMRAALQIAENLNIPIEVVDREIKVTLRRTWASMSFWSVVKLIFSSIFSYSEADEISSEQIETLKNEDELSAAIKEFSRELPQIKETLINERDLYMASKLQKVPGNKIVAIVGAGHLEGITRYLESNEVLSHEHLEAIPPPSKISKLLGYGIPALIVGFFIYGFIAFDSSKGFDLLATWAIATGICAGLGALIALAHPLTIVSAILAAPIASLHPAIATGWVSGLVEAWLKKPHVSDFEALAEDLGSLSGFWRNRVMRILLVVSFSNLGCMVGMWLGSAKLIEML
jgi:pheromone shutdown-related protein TraB